MSADRPRVHGCSPEGRPLYAFGFCIPFKDATVPSSIRFPEHLTMFLGKCERQTTADLVVPTPPTPDPDNER